MNEAQCRNAIADKPSGDGSKTTPHQEPDGSRRSACMNEAQCRNAIAGNSFRGRYPVSPEDIEAPLEGISEPKGDKRSKKNHPHEGIPAGIDWFDLADGADCFLYFGVPVAA
jgi:hypothetical protein